MAENRNRSNQSSGGRATTTRRSTGTGQTTSGRSSGSTGTSRSRNTSTPGASSLGSTAGYGMESTSDRDDVMDRYESESASRNRSRGSSASDNSTDLMNRLQALGVNEQMIDTAKSFIINAVEGKLRSLDVQESLSTAGQVATRSVRRMQSNRPALFYAGIATLAAGVGLLIGSAIEKEYEYELTYEPEL